MFWSPCKAPLPFIAPRLSRSRMTSRAMWARCQHGTLNMHAALGQMTTWIIQVNCYVVFGSTFLAIEAVHSRKYPALLCSSQTYTIQITEALLFSTIFSAIITMQSASTFSVKLFSKITDDMHSTAGEIPAWHILYARCLRTNGNKSLSETRLCHIRMCLSN